MIVGIGSDVVELSRIDSVYQRQGERFAKRILTTTEREIMASKANPVAYLAKRFAAKEAASKALGTGIGKISFQDFQVLNNDLGQPMIEFTGAAKKRLQDMGGQRAWISLTDERELALAFVVLES